MYGPLNRVISDDREFISRLCTYCTRLNAIFRTAMQQLTRFQLTWRDARSLCDSWASCLEPESC